MDALKISKEIISILESNGLKIDNVYRTNGYFLFDLGENSVTHFKLRNRRWKFGIWITEGEESGLGLVELFGEHVDNIDKFKPSYTKISFGIFWVRVILNVEKLSTSHFCQTTKSCRII